jgi:hypothetical protein
MLRERSMTSWSNVSSLTSISTARERYASAAYSGRVSKRTAPALVCEP